MSERRKSFLERRIDYGPFISIAICIVCVAVATLIRVVTGLVGPTLVFATFFPAVLVSALLGGWLGGLLAIPLSIIAVWWAFIPPLFGFGPLRPVDTANFSLFALSSVFVVWLAVSYRRMVRELEKREKERTLLVGEIEHRSKNILAVVTSLIQRTIKDKILAETLINRIRVAANTDDLLSEPSTKAVNLAALLVAEVERPNGQSRVQLHGPLDVIISGAQANALRIVLHEMTTNALKYGALSETEGKVRISWSKESAQVQIIWCEFDGPKVSAPAAFNFGSRLITATLRQVDAEFEPTFPDTGYCYKIAFTLPKSDVQPLFSSEKR